MATDRSPTVWAAPFFFFSSEELFHTVRFDGREVLKKAHPEKLLISGIDVCDVLTGKLRAFRTKCYGML